VFFKVLAAIVTADAFDRHMREQQHRAWASQMALGAAPADRPKHQPGASRVQRGDLTAPERPRAAG
jgi:hypothetical protein